MLKQYNCIEQVIENSTEVQSTLLKQGQFIYSSPVGPAKKGETPILRHPQAKNGLSQIPSQYNSIGVFWSLTVNNRSNHPAFDQITYAEADLQAKSLGSWMKKNQHDKFFLYMKNCSQWTISDIAGFLYGSICVPLYDTLGPEAFPYILTLVKGTLLICNQNVAQNLLDTFKRTKDHSVKTILFIQMPTEDKIHDLQQMGIKVLKWSEVVKQNMAKNVEQPKIQLDNMLSICFTSGTTGIPKGVVITHRNIVAQILGVRNHFEQSSEDVHLSYLPLAHVMQRYCIWALIQEGASIRYSKLPITEIAKQFAKNQPTFIPIVPRLLNKLYTDAQAMYKQDGNYDRVKALFGGKTKTIGIGSAPISPHILSFFKNGLNCDVRQAYGQTQTLGASFIIYKNQSNFGHVDGPNRSLEFKLVDVPQMNYLTSGPQPKGQICVRGESVFKQYYLNPKATAETIDQDGWNHTGDIGVLLPNGAIKIIDRKKNIYKLSQGQYVAPEKVQGVYSRSSYVEQCFVYGDSMKDHNVAIIYPNIPALLKISPSLGITQTGPEKLCNDPIINKFVLEEITKVGKQQKLFGFEQAKQILLIPKSMTLKGVYTSTMKLQRHNAKNAFINEINAMYTQFQG